jgi:hypothetical protein
MAAGGMQLMAISVALLAIGGSVALANGMKIISGSVAISGNMAPCASGRAICNMGLLALIKQAAAGG